MTARLAAALRLPAVRFFFSGRFCARKELARPDPEFNALVDAALRTRAEETGIGFIAERIHEPEVRAALQPSAKAAGRSGPWNPPSALNRHRSVRSPLLRRR